jgi:hypothetical protein
LLLIVIEGEVRLSGRAFRGCSVLRQTGADRGDQVLFSETLEWGRATLSRGGDLVDSQWAIGLTDDLQHGPLFGGEFEGVPPFGDAGCRLVERDEPRARQTFDSGRDDRLKDLSPGAEVPLGDPAGEFEHLRGEEWLSIDEFGDRLELPGRAKALAEPDAVADRQVISAAEGDPDALTGLHLGPEWIGNEVVEDRIERTVEDDVRHHAVGVRGRLPRSQWRLGSKQSGSARMRGVSHKRRSNQ